MGEAAAEGVTADPETATDPEAAADLRVPETAPGSPAAAPGSAAGAHQGSYPSDATHTTPLRSFIFHIRRQTRTACS